MKWLKIIFLGSLSLFLFASALGIGAAVYTQTDIFKSGSYVSCEDYSNDVSFTLFIPKEGTDIGWQGNHGVSGSVERKVEYVTPSAILISWAGDDNSEVKTYINRLNGEFYATVDDNRVASGNCFDTQANF